MTNENASFFSTFHSAVILNINEKELSTVFRSLLEKNEQLTDEKSVVDIMKIVHEFAHFWQWIGTSAGFYLTTLTMTQSFLVKNLLRYFSYKNILDYKLPLLNDTNGRDSEEINEIIETKKLWNSIEYYRRSILLNSIRPTMHEENLFLKEGFPLAQIAINSFMQNRTLKKNIWDLGETIPKHDFISLSELTKNIQFPKKRTKDRLHSYSVGTSLGDRCLSTLTIMEGFSFLTEFNAYLKYGKSLTSKNKIDERINQHSSLHYNYSLNLAKLILENKVDLTLLLYIHDLALMGSWFPMYNGKGSNNKLEFIGWDTVEPGYRYLQALATLKEMHVTETNCPDNYENIIDEICTRNNWEKPFQMAMNTKSLFVPYMNELDNGLRCSMFLNHSIYGDHFHRHFKAMEKRTNNKSCFVDVVSNFRDLYGDLTSSIDKREYTRPTSITGFSTEIEAEQFSGSFLHNLFRTIAVGTEIELRKGIEDGRELLRKQFSYADSKFSDYQFEMLLLKNNINYYL